MCDKDFISIIIPVYGCPEVLKKLHEGLVLSLEVLNVNFEIIMVNDFCPFGSEKELEKLTQKDNRVKVINLTKNFGQHHAIKAGLDSASGDYTIIMDCDLQDNPKYIADLYKKIKSGNVDVVACNIIQRNDNLIKKMYSKLANLLIDKLTDFNKKRQKNNYCIFNKKVLNALQKYNEQNFVFGACIAWLGFDIDFIEINKDKRPIGNSSYNFFKSIVLLSYIIVNNSNKPLMFSIFCSFLFFILCLLFVLKLFVEHYIHGCAILGWTSLMITILFIGSLIFANLAILGIYIGQIYKETKSRPLYVVKNKVNF